MSPFYCWCHLILSLLSPLPNLSNRTISPNTITRTEQLLSTAYDHFHWMRDTQTSLCWLITTSPYYAPRFNIFADYIQFYNVTRAHETYFNLYLVACTVMIRPWRDILYFYKWVNTAYFMHWILFFIYSKDDWTLKSIWGLIPTHTYTHTCNDLDPIKADTLCI